MKVINCRGRGPFPFSSLQFFPVERRECHLKKESRKNRSQYLSQRWVILIGYFVVLRRGDPRKATSQHGATSAAAAVVEAADCPYFCLNAKRN